MATDWCLVGGVRSSSATITGEVQGGTARLVYSSDPDMANAAVANPLSGGGGVPFRWELRGLSAQTTYWFALWDVDNDNEPDYEKSGYFRTHAPENTPWSHVVRVIGDAGLAPDYPGENTTTIPGHRVSNPPIASDIASFDADYTAHLGDMHYGNPGEPGAPFVPDASEETLAGIYRDVFRQPHHGKLFRQPLAYIYDDHDFVGGNDAVGEEQPDKINLARVYRRFFPSYSLPESGPIYHSWQMGRVLYIFSDTRYNKSSISAPDGPGKTMLGSQQIEWMQRLLTTTRAEALVWLMPTPWLGGHVDTWSSYAYERGALAEWLKTTHVPASRGSRTWAESMVQVSADVHALALSSGAGNPWGGFPVMLAASLDATPSAASGSQYDLGFVGGRDQWGTVTVTDSGSSVTLAMTGWSRLSEWGTHSVTVRTDYAPDPVPPDGSPPAGTRAAPVPTVDWYAYDLKTLQRLVKLPGVGGDIARAIGAYESATLTVPTPLIGPMANRLVTHQVTAPNTLIVAEINNVPAWTGIVWKTFESSEGGYTLACATPESYFDRRYTGTLEYEQVEQVDIVASLASVAADELGIPLEYDLKPTGILRDRRYYDDEDATLYQRMQELSGVIDGPEWTVRAEYADEHGSRLRLVLDCRAEVGAGKSTPRGPIATRGSARATWKLGHSWDKGSGGNAIIATGSGEGEKRPQSVEISRIAPGHPKIEHRFSPGASIKEPATLTSHASGRLREIGGGTTTLDISARWDRPPVRLGVDIDIGDWAHFHLYGPTRPAGLIVERRMVGYRMRTGSGTFNPVFVGGDADE